MNLIKQSHGQSYVLDDVPIFVAEEKPPKFVHLLFFFFPFELEFTSYYRIYNLSKSCILGILTGGD